jgi:hypothetical protein
MTSRGEQLLRMFIKRCFPKFIQKYNVRDLGIVNTITKAPLEIDIYLPELRLGFEFQGGQHRTDPEQKKRDIMKQLQCKKRGILLINIWTATLIGLNEYLLSKLSNYPIKQPSKTFLEYFNAEANEYKKNIYKMNSSIKSNTFIKRYKRGRK